MSDAIYERVRRNPKFHELVARRGRFAMFLTVLVLGSYYAFMMLVAFAPDIFRVPLFEGGALTTGVPVGAALIIGSWLLTGWFVNRANGEFDEINQEIVREASK